MGAHQGKVLGEGTSRQTGLPTFDDIDTEIKKWMEWRNKYKIGSLGYKASSKAIASLRKLKKYASQVASEGEGFEVVAVANLLSQPFSCILSDEEAQKELDALTEDFSST